MCPNSLVSAALQQTKERERVIRAMHGRSSGYCATINRDNGAHFWSAYFCCLWRESNVWGNEQVAGVFCRSGGSVTALSKTCKVEEEEEEEESN